LSIDSDSSGTQIRMKIPIPPGSSAGVDTAAAHPVPDPDVAPRKKPRARKAARRARSAR
jgi:hypothetical protein